jgi:hypothetical protein
MLAVSFVLESPDPQRRLNRRLEPVPESQRGFLVHLLAQHDELVPSQSSHGVRSPGSGDARTQPTWKDRQRQP